MKFSVIVCTYNFAHLLPDALRSIAAQSVSDYELLIVDDGSTDNTEQVAEQFRPQFPDCRYLKKDHTGPADSRNAGVLAARGDYIAFLDADDLWSTDYLSTFQKALLAHPQAELAFCEGIVFRSENGTVTEAALHRPLPQISGSAPSPSDLFELIQAFTPSGMVFSKALFERTGPFDANSFTCFCEDIDWTLRALLAGAICLCVKKRLYLYRRHDGNLTNRAGDSFRGWLNVCDKTLKESRANPEIEMLARGVTRAKSLRFLPSCSTSEGRILLRQAIRTMGGDAWIRICYAGTFLGLIRLLKITKLAKQFILRISRKKLEISLRPSATNVFRAVHD